MSDVRLFPPGVGISLGDVGESESLRGEVRITLDNRDRRFDPMSTSSPYYPGEPREALRRLIDARIDARLDGRSFRRRLLRWARRR